jgi:hypothetical protein
MADATTGVFNLTAPATLCFPSLFEAKKFKGKNGKESGEPKYQSTFAFNTDHPDLGALKSLAIQVAKAKWPGRDIAADFKAKTFKMPWSSGDALIEKRKKALADKGTPYDGKADFAAGKVMIKSASKFAPKLAIIEGGRIIDLEGPALVANKGKFYFGVEALGQLNFVAYDAVGDNGTDGVTAYCNLVLSINRGKRLSGGATASEVFKDYAGKLSAEDPTAGETLEDVEGF